VVVIGAGRIGVGLQREAAARGLSVRLIDRVFGWDALDAPAGSPVLVVVRNDDLAAVVQRVPAARRDDLVFVQNGAIGDLLGSLGVGESTRGLLYFLVARRGDGITPGRTSWFSGRHGAAVAAWLGTLGLVAEDVDGPTFAAHAFEKLLWLSTNGLLCQARGATVGEVATAHRAELAALVTELMPIGARARGVGMSPAAMAERLADYSATIPDYRASVKEWPTRNGWLVKTARLLGIGTPLHDALIASVGAP